MVWPGPGVNAFVQGVRSAPPGQTTAALGIYLDLGEALGSARPVEHRSTHLVEAFHLTAQPIGETKRSRQARPGHSLFVRGDCPLGEARHAELVGGGARLLEEPAALG